MRLVKTANGSSKNTSSSKTVKTVNRKQEQRYDKIIKLLESNNFISKKFDDYILWKIRGGDIIFIRLYSDKLEVYPLGNFKPYMSNRIFLKDYNFDKDFYINILTNDNNN